MGDGESFWGKGRPTKARSPEIYERVNVAGSGPLSGLRTVPGDMRNWRSGDKMREDDERCVLLLSYCELEGDRIELPAACCYC